MMLIVTSISLKNKGDHICELHARAGHRLHVMQRVDDCIYSSPWNLAATPLLHVCHHLNGSELMLFSLISYNDTVLLTKQINLFEQKLQSKEIGITICGSIVFKMQFSFVNGRMNDAQIKFFEYVDYRFEGVDQLLRLHVRPAT